jgi:hypothetical protein
MYNIGLKMEATDLEPWWAEELAPSWPQLAATPFTHD